MNAVKQVPRETMKIEELDPNPLNPRKDLAPGDHEFELIAQSIHEFGEVGGIVWNKRTKRLVAGHQRVRVMKTLGYTEATVAVVDEDEEREKALMVALNNPKIGGDWNYDTLASVMSSLSEDVFPLSGFSAQYEIDEMMRSVEASRATDFLNFDDEDFADKAGPGAAELKDDHPHRTGPQYFQINLVLTQEQRDIYLETVSKAKAAFGLQNSMEATIAICEEFNRSRVGA